MDKNAKVSGLVGRLSRELGREPTIEECQAAADFPLPDGMQNVRLHDLRHSFASVAAGLGEGLHMIEKMLGHSQAQTTARYAHLATDPVKAATEKVGERIAALLDGTESKTSSP